MDNRKPDRKAPMSASPAAPSLTLVGCGKMGTAMLRGWLSSGLARRIDVIEPNGLPPELFGAGLTCHRSVEDYIAAGVTSRFFVMAVKPQVMDDVCAALKPAVHADALILSIAAGQTIAAYEGRFGATQPVIRTMPNTPASIGKGMTVAIANKNITPGQKALADRALQATGLVEWTDDESLLDAVTAVSGSGPAYVFLMIEALAAAGMKAGLPDAMAVKLARQTIIGAGALTQHEKDTDAATLRKNVTSPGGTTEAALKILMRNDGLEALMTEAVAAATKRSRELSG
jgi:pyrroline-5-carboxylate reductase